jgi:bla regulator protein BlaR1
VLDDLEDCKLEMGVHTPLTVVETAAVNSPSLFGFIRPRLLLPAGLTERFSLHELRYVFLHELGHVKRGDIPMNWLAMVPLILHWFNPFVWYAVNRMRVDGEVACDALALSYAQETERQPYGQTIIKLVEHFSRPAVAPGLLGILENNHQMKRRIRMNHEIQ